MSQTNKKLIEKRIKALQEKFRQMAESISKDFALAAQPGRGYSIHVCSSSCLRELPTIAAQIGTLQAIIDEGLYEEQ